MKISSAIVSEQGSRGYMEDAYFLDLDFNKKCWIFGGVYDGHNGREAAEYVVKNLQIKFLKVLSISTSVTEAFIKSYEKISKELKGQDSGICAANFLIKRKTIYFANVGDVRILVIGKNNFRQLTTHHRLDNISERQRIEEMGGEIEYVYAVRGAQGLMPTRTIGDEYFKPIGIIATPSVGRYRVSDDDLFLITATDGLFDVMTDKEITDFSRKFDNPNDLAQALKTEVLINRHGSDNLTIIVLKLK